MALSYQEKIIRAIRVSGILFVLVGVIMLLVSLSADSGLLDYHSYEFEVETHPTEKVQLQEFQIEYDFVNYQGRIHFRLTRTNYTDYLVFRLPEEVEVTSLNWTDRSNKYDDNFTSYQEKRDYEIESKLNSYQPIHLIFTVENINKTNKEYWSTIDLEFKGKLYPNAEFGFTPSTEKIKPPSGIENGAFFKFNLEDKYTCTQPCYESFRKEELEFHYRENKLTVATKKEPPGWKDIGYHIFNLNYNKENNELLTNLREISYILISLGFIPALEFFILKYYKNKRRNKRNKK